jgi:hypothetical protein
MPAFNGQITTPLAVPDPGTDHLLPSPGALSYGAITSPSAVAGTNGAHATLINGNNDCQTNGNESTRITQNRSHTIGGNQDKKICGNKTENVIQNFLQTTMGNLHRTVIGAALDTYVGEHTVEHKSDQHLSEIAAFYHKVKDYAENHTWHMDDYINYQLHAATVQNFIGWNLDVKGLQNALIGYCGEAHLIKNKADGLENDVKEMQNKITALDDRIGAIQPVVHITMLHEVAITQKILVVGVNQFM